MNIILKKQKIQISFGSIVTEMADTGCVVLIFWIQINFNSHFFKKKADYPQLYILEDI